MTQDSTDELADAYNTALALEKAGDADGAAAAYRRVLALDADDPGGAAVRLAALGRAEAPARAPEAYVERLFDQHAEVFEEILVDRLGYHVPLMLREALEAHAPGPYARLLDLGCGTGLVAVALSGLTEHRTGIDLSSNMVEIAGELDLYDDLYIGDAVGFVEDIDDDPWDLVAAADVLPYLGDLAPLFRGVRRVMAAGGIFGFSTEALPADAARQDYAVGPCHRFCHARGYVDRQLAAAGFDPLHWQDIVVRHEEGVPQPGHLVLARAR
jgi:predicted TPR repeat methyltransferase